MILRNRETALRFAAVGVVNTLIDVTLFLLLHGSLGLVVANLVSTCSGMAFSFVANGLFTFQESSLTFWHAARFVATTGFTQWALQPVLIMAILRIVDVAVFAKLTATLCCVVVNFVAYKLVVWRPAPAAVASDVTAAHQPV